MAAISLKQIIKEYVPHVRAVDEVTLDINDGEFFVLVGPSGCGKSTLLRMIAGLEFPSSGTISIDGRDVTNLAPRDRDIAMVFQNYAIYPHMTVRRNIGYGLKVRKTPKSAVHERVNAVARLLGIEELLERRPSTLSGGQLQRVAMGRAIAREPQIYLMDEPLSNLDAKLRVTMRAELGRLHQRLGVTTLYVTHDQVEAMTLGQRAAVLRDGVLQQVDTPQGLYRNPANAFVAAFIGSPAMNIAVGTISEGVLEFAGFRIGLPDRLRPPVSDGERLLVGVRPEDFRDPRFAPPDAQIVTVECAVQQDLGNDTLVFFSVPCSVAEHAEILAATFDPDQSEAAVEEAEHRLFAARVPSGSEVAPDIAKFALCAEDLTFFDVPAGRRLGREASVT